MRRRAGLPLIILTGGALTLSACGLADSRSPLPLPDFMRAKAADPPAMEQPPDVKRLVRERLDAVFVAQSNPQNVRVSEARHALRGLGWTACVRAELTSATGKPLGEQIYRISINGGVVTDRQRIEAEDTCLAESYQPI